MSETTVLEHEGKKLNINNCERFFFNKEYENFYSELCKFNIFMGEYENDESDKPDFVLKNRNMGFCQMLEDLRKFLFVKFQCERNEDGKCILNSCWIVNSDTHPNEFSDISKSFNLVKVETDDAYKFMITNNKDEDIQEDEESSDDSDDSSIGSDYVPVETDIKEENNSNNEPEGAYVISTDFLH